MENIYIKEGQTLSHYGIKGQKWGVRRYQNEDGSLTSLGRIHYNVEKGAEGAKKEGLSKYNSLDEKGKRKYGKRLANIEKRYSAPKNPLVETRSFDVSFRYSAEKSAKKASEKAEKVREIYGENSDKYKKAADKEKRAIVLSEYAHAKVEKMKELEIRNLNDDTYQHNRNVDAGMQLATTALATAAGLTLAATTGVGFYAVPRGNLSSLTSKQIKEANEYASKVKELVEKAF